MEVFLIIYATLFIGSPLIALLHETGHAIAYLVLTKPKSIDVYVGSYGDNANNMKLEVGKLNYYIKRSFPFVRSIGLCKSSEMETNYLNYVIILLSGPVFTFLIAVIIACIVAALGGNHHLYVVIVCYIFLGLSALSLISNLIPREVDAPNRKLSSDGKQILFTLKLKKGFTDYILANRFLIEKDYYQAIEKHKSILDLYPRNKYVLSTLIGTLILSKQYNEAKKYLAQLETITKLSNTELINKGYLQVMDKQYSEAINTFNLVLENDLNNIIALNNIGHCLIEQKEYNAADKIMDRAIKASPNYLFSYCNMALVKLGQGDLLSAKILIDRAIELEPDYAGSYQCLTIYYLKMKDVVQAEFNLSKTAELDKTLVTSELVEELEQLKAEAIA